MRKLTRIYTRNNRENLLKKLRYDKAAEKWKGAAIRNVGGNPQISCSSLSEC